MARPDKQAKVAELTARFQNSAAVVLTEYRGLSVGNLKELRRSLGDAATYAIAKNTLTKIAAKEAGVEGLNDQLEGPTAIAFIDEDIASVAKGLRDFAKANPFLVIKGGVMDGKILDADTVKKLADLESRETLLGKLAGGMKANLSRAAFMLAAPASKTARVLGALQKAAEENPDLIGGAGEAKAQAPADDAKADSDEDTKNDQTPAADAATDAEESAE